jgi:guanylate kinase
VISGPSGVGKGTLYKLLLSRHPSIFSTSISHTTRDPRPGEQRDVDYYYITMDEFEKMIEERAFVEYAKFGGNRYGTSKRTISELTASGRVVVLDIEMEVCFLFLSLLLNLENECSSSEWLMNNTQGVKQIKSSHIEARYIFISPPSMSVLESRLRGRGTEKEESVQKRLAQARNELEYSKTEGAHDLIIVNDDLETAYKELEEFIFKKKTQEQGAKDESAAGVSVQD